MKQRQSFRLVPDEPFPPYAYIPTRFPHPVRNPKGHSYGEGHQKVKPPDPQYWQKCCSYLYGIDLFNHGYYWEAHDAWESVWLACGKKGVTADFLKGLIKLAAAGVKAMGLSLTQLIGFANRLRRNPIAVSSNDPVKVVFRFELRPLV